MKILKRFNKRLKRVDKVDTLQAESSLSELSFENKGLSRCVSIRTRQNGKKSAFSLLSVLKYVSIPATFRLEKSRFFIRFRSKIYCLGFLCQCKAKTQLMLCAFASILTQQWRENPGNKRVRILTHLLSLARRSPRQPLQGAVFAVHTRENRVFLRQRGFPL